MGAQVTMPYARIRVDKMIVHAKRANNRTWNPTVESPIDKKDKLKIT